MPTREDETDLSGACKTEVMEVSPGPRLKVHRRTVRLDRSEYTILSPRPTEEARFATNYFHETWHVITSQRGAALLARLCWAMAFQRRERTVVLIDTPLIVPTPFDADLSSPIAIVNNDLGAFGRAAVKDLRAQLPLSKAPDGTVVLQTRGLDQALENTTEFHGRNHETQLQNQHRKRRWVDGSNGLAIVSAPPPVLRTWGVDLAALGTWSHEGRSWEYLDYPAKVGEVQVLDDFDSMLVTAQAARDRAFPGAANRRLTEDERSKIWAELQQGLEPTAPSLPDQGPTFTVLNSNASRTSASKSRGLAAELRY